jgi:hypothetical protein
LRLGFIRRDRRHASIRSSRYASNEISPRHHSGHDFFIGLKELSVCAVVKALDTKQVENELLLLPTNLASGIDASDDPLINTRTEAYAASFGRRTK